MSNEIYEKKIIISGKIQKNKVNIYRRYLEKLKIESQEYAEKINDSISKRLAKELAYIVRTYVDAFYEDYNPNSYQRTGDLYNIYDISKRYSISIGPQYMKYHGEQAPYIFEYSLEYGYHGSHINPDFGIPWWKKPPAYKEWYMPAKKTTAYYPYMKHDLIASIKRHQKTAQQMINEKNKELANKAIAKRNSINFYKRK